MLRKFAVLLLSLPLSACLHAEDSLPKTLAEASAKFMAVSSLREPGSQPFHLKLTVRDVQDPDSDKHAEIEEYWASPTSWKRIVTAPGLKQIVTVNASGRYVQSTGTYLPTWLQAFLSALEEPIPPAIRNNKLTEFPPQAGPPGSDFARCANLSITAKDFPAAPANICFAEKSKLANIIYPGYRMMFGEYSRFAGKDVPYLYLSQYGSLLAGKIGILEKLPKNADFAVPEGAVTADPLASVLIGPSVISRLARSPLKITWPQVPGGKTSGSVLAYVSLDNTGTPREAMILQSDNLHLDKAVRQQLLDMRWRPASVNGKPVQVTTLLSLPFETTHSNTQATATPTQTISPDEAKGTALTQPAPHYPLEARSKGITGSVYLSALIDETGAVSKLGVIESSSPLLTTAAMDAVKQWKYKPYMVDGMPTSVSTTITVNFKMIGR